VNRKAFGSGRQDSLLSNTDDLKRIEECDQMIGITTKKTSRQTLLLHGGKGSGGSANNSNGSNNRRKGSGEIHNGDNVSDDNNYHRHHHGKCETPICCKKCCQIFWPELDHSPSGRLMYRMLRCLSTTEMKDLNFEQLQKDQIKFDRFQHTKYYRSTVLVSVIFFNFFYTPKN
jgi:hypothetical protein